MGGGDERSDLNLQFVCAKSGNLKIETVTSEPV
jgi:hypothetical protein